MSDDGWFDNHPWLETFLLWVLLVGVIVGPSIVYAATFDVDINNQARFHADSGPTIWFSSDIDIESGNPFQDSNTINISASAGELNVTSTNDVEAQIDTINESGGSQWTNASSLAVTAGNLTFNPRGNNKTKIEGDATGFNFTTIKVDDGDLDFIYTGNSGSSNITVVTNATDGTQYGAVDTDTNEGLDVAVADSNGQIFFTELDSSQTHNVRVEELGKLFIREETSPHSKITSCSATIRFFESENDDPTIKEKSDSDSDGEIDLTGLPVDEQFVATIKCASYHNRSTVIEDLSQQETVFLLNKSRTANEITFDIDDTTGKFGGDKTDLIIQKAINRSEYNGDPAGFSWTNVGGDNLGADSQYTIDLENEDRYRIKVRNDEGDTRILGSFTPEKDETVVLEIGSAVIDPEGTEEPAWFANYTNVSGGNNEVHVEYNDSTDNTTTLYIEIYNRSDSTDHLFTNTSFSNVGTVTVDETVPSGEQGTEWVVKITAVRENEDNIVAKEIVGPRQPVLGGLDPWIITVIFIGIIWLVAGLFSQLNGSIGAIVVAALGAMFFFVKFVPTELGSGVMILALVLAGIIFMRDRQRSGGL